MKSLRSIKNSFLILTVVLGNGISNIQNKIKKGTLATGDIIQSK